MAYNTEVSRYSKQYITIYGKKMAYIDEGQGDPIVFLHGNPTSSFLWRNVMPYLEGKGRLIAPDLIGMGDSEKLENSGPDSYTYVEQRKYLFALLAALGVTSNVTLVIHDWGSVLGFDWARQNAAAVKGIALMEAIVAPLSSWDVFSEDARAAFQAFRSPAGEAIVLNQNAVIEQVLPSLMIRELSDVEMNEYRRPFLEAGEARRPTLTWTRQIPVAGEPAEVVEIVESYSAWLTRSEIPKLFVNAEQGVIIVGPVEDLVRSFPSTTEVTVPGSHYLQEDSPDLIGEAIAKWLAQIS